jgi:antitoxin (DNA-binding transcriptional repressor) of toxin-antitoxin stability system
MKTATVADLRNHFSRISAWIEHGETVRIIKRGKPFARLTAESGTEQPFGQKIDVMAQLKEIWGDRVFSEEEVRAMREAELEGEDG